MVLAEPRQVLTRNKSSLVSHALLPPRVKRISPALGYVHCRLWHEEPVHTCASLSQTHGHTCPPALLGQPCLKDEVTAIQSKQVVGQNLNPGSK